MKAHNNQFEVMTEVEVVEQTLQMGAVRDLGGEVVVMISYQTELGRDYIQDSSCITDSLSDSIDSKQLAQTFEAMGLNREDSFNLVSNIKRVVRQNSSLSNEIDGFIDDAFYGVEKVADPITVVLSSEFEEHIKGIENPEIRKLLQRVLIDLPEFVETCIKMYNRE